MQRSFWKELSNTLLSLIPSLFFHLHFYLYTLLQGRHETPPCPYCLALAPHTCAGCLWLDFCLIVTAVKTGLSQLFYQICQDPVKMWQPSLFQFLVWISRKATSGYCSLPTGRHTKSSVKQFCNKYCSIGSQAKCSFDSVTPWCSLIIIELFPEEFTEKP